MHDEIRTGPPYGHALSTPHRCAAQIKTTLSFHIDAGIGDHWFNSRGEWTVRMEGSRIVFPALEKTIA
jgi:hypothetical protein